MPYLTDKTSNTRPQPIIEKIPFEDDYARGAYDRLQRARGWHCQFLYLASDRRGRDLYQITREKL